jgi:hypothetical protein
LFVFVLCLMCPMLRVSLDCLFSSCVLCAQCYLCLWIVCFRPVSYVPNVTCVSGLFVFVLCLMCPMLPVSLDCLFSSCVLCAHCYLRLWIVHRAHKTQDEDKQSRDTGNIGHIRHRMKTNNPETQVTLGT